MKMCAYILVLLYPLIALTQPMYAAAAEEYVSSDGNDSNDGTSWANAKATPQAAIAVLASTGGTVLIASGTYPGPTDLSNNTAMLCEMYAAPSSTLHANNRFWLSTPDKKCVFTYTSALILDSLQSLKVQGITFDFSGTAHGLVLKGVTNSVFIDDNFQNGTSAAYAISIYGAGKTQVNQSADLLFERTGVFQFGGAAYLSGTANETNAVTWTTFRRLIFFSATGSLVPVIDIVQGADTNLFEDVHASQLRNFQPCLKLNDSATPLVDVNANNNMFLDLMCDAADASTYATSLLAINQSLGNEIFGLSGNWGDNPEVATQGSPIYDLKVTADFGNGFYNKNMFDTLFVPGIAAIGGEVRVGITGPSLFIEKGDVSAARNATEGAYFLGSDGSRLFRNNNTASLKYGSFTANFPAANGTLGLSGANGLSAGTVTLFGGTGSHSFPVPYAKSPICTLGQTTPAFTYIYSATTTAIAIHSSSSDDNSVVSWMCSPAVN